jgi:hypothetical protein
VRGGSHDLAWVQLSCVDSNVEGQKIGQLACWLTARLDLAHRTLVRFKIDSEIPRSPNTNAHGQGQLELEI